jgi:membrane protein YdbS with pleckstrin-like domain
VVFVAIVPLWRYRVHRWDIGPKAVYTRSGWLIQERRIAPISRVQTVDTYRGPGGPAVRLANVTVTTASSAGRCASSRWTPTSPTGRRPAHRHRRDRRGGRDVTDDGGVASAQPANVVGASRHEVLRQIPLLIGAVVLGSATGNSWWTVAALAVTIVFGVLRWFTTSYRIEPDEVQLREGVFQRKVISLPRNRIRSVQTDAGYCTSSSG